MDSDELEFDGDVPEFRDLEIPAATPLGLRRVGCPGACGGSL